MLSDLPILIVVDVVELRRIIVLLKESILACYILMLFFYTTGLGKYNFRFKS